MIDFITIFKMLDVWLKKNNDLKFDEDNNSENFIFITCGVS
jgi:hypothetical protein